MTEPVDSERPNIQSDNVCSGIGEVVQSIIEKMIDES